LVTSSPQPPVLILGFNRPDRMRGVIDSLRPLSPPLVLVSLDGPRTGHPTDTARVHQCKAETARIDWTPDVRTRFRETNAGLEIAVPAAVSWALEEHDSVIVIEDDVIVGPNFLEFATTCLDAFHDRDDIWHVSGYNVVPVDHLTRPTAAARLSVFPESFAWATWRRAWQRYDPDLTWASQAPIGELREIVGSTAAAMRWKEIFGDARQRRISTWAYRWIGSIWSERGLCVSPNRNLITYAGYDEGTHTRRRARWNEFAVEPLPDTPLADEIGIDPLADAYLGRQVFRGTPAGVLVGAAESLAMEVLRRRG
jgi:hypothetical protein